MFNNFNAFNNFRQAYEIYSNAIQYVTARETYMNQTINKMEIEVKLRLQNLDKILTDYYQLYNEIEKEAAKYVNHRTFQENRIARIEDHRTLQENRIVRIEEEVKRLRILLENKSKQDTKITKLEEEVKNLRILKEINQNQAAEQTKAQNKDKSTSSTQTENINNDYVFINNKELSKAKNSTKSLSQTQKTNDDQLNDFINSQEPATVQNVNKLSTQTQKINNDNLNGFMNCKQQTKTKTNVTTRLLKQSQKNDINMIILCNEKENAKDNIENLTRSSIQSEKTSDNIDDDFFKSKCQKSSLNNKNLVATKGKKWNNHNINIWLEQKLNLKAKNRAWNVTVFGEYKHIEFSASEYKQFMWKNREKWEEEGIWLWFEC